MELSGNGEALRSRDQQIMGQDQTGGGNSRTVIEERLVADDMLKFGNNAANDVYTLRCKEEGIKIHPARFPSALPAFFKLLTDPGDVVLDFFAGSNTTGAVAEKLERRWVATNSRKSIYEPASFVFRTDAIALKVNTVAPSAGFRSIPNR